MSDEEGSGPHASFIKLGAGRGLTKKTMVLLYDEGYTNIEALGDILERQMRDLNIPAAQKFRLRKLVEDLLLARNEEPDLIAAAGNDKADNQNKAETPGATASEEKANAPAGEGTQKEPSESTGATLETAGAESAETDDAQAHREGPLTFPKDTIISKMMRPHEAVFGEKTKDGNFLQFLYANLLTLENMYVSDSVEAVGHLHHLHFVTLKLMQQYPTERVFLYDHVVRSKIDAAELKWQNRSTIGLEDEIVSEHFDADHLAKWKKMRRSKLLQFKRQGGGEHKIDRCIRWNMGSGGKELVGETCGDEECKFEHACLLCSASHPSVKCPTIKLDRQKKASLMKLKAAAHMAGSGLKKF